MTKEEREVMRMALEGFKNAHANFGEWWPHIVTAIEKCLANDALEKKAENARELGLSYD